MTGVKGKSGGHNRKTTQKLKEEGGYRATRHRDRVDDKIAPAQLKCPEHLGEVGRDAWKRVTETLPAALITNLDPDSLAMFCDLLEAYSILRKEFLADPLDRYVRTSYFSTVAAIDKLGRQFGWTPQSRAGLNVKQQSNEEESAFSSLLARMSGTN